MMHLRLSGREPGLIGYWDLDEGEGTSAIDRTGRNNDGTILGASYILSGVYLNAPGQDEFCIELQTSASG